MNRRSFLATSSLATGTLLLGNLASKARAATQPDAGSKDLNIAIIGVGAQGRILLEDVLLIPHIRVKAICDIWKYSGQYAVNKLKKAGQEAKLFTDIDDLLAQKDALGLDAAIVATPDFWHAPHTIACHKAGLHVYSEKMMSNTVEGARSMVRSMRDSQKLLQIGHQRYSNPRYQYVYKQLIQNKPLDGKHVYGRFVGAQAQWNRAVTEPLGYPKIAEIPADTLRKYGFKDMRQFRNWRWYKDLSGGPISDLGAHQIDIFKWYLGVNPAAVYASGGVDYYKDNEQYDNVMAIFEYPLEYGTVRAFYQVQTATSSGGGYFETFMGDNACLTISENPKNTAIFRENAAPDWAPLVQRGILRQAAAPAPKADAVVDARETKALVGYEIPVTLNKPPHQPHLENFFDAVRKFDAADFAASTHRLTCPADHAFESEAAVFKVNPACAAKERLVFKPEDFVA
jgi:predicted dehydrogenase